MTEITFGESASEFILELFDKEYSDEGYVIDSETGKRVESLCGDHIEEGNFAGVMKDEYGDPVFIRDHFSELVEAAKLEGKSKKINRVRSDS